MHLTHETTLLDVWNDFAGMLTDVDPEVTPPMLNRSKRTFYTGAVTMYALINKRTAQILSDEESGYGLQQLLEEMNRYFHDEKAAMKDCE